MSIELMLNGVNLSLVNFARVWGQNSAHVFVLMIMGVAAAEVAVGLAILIAVFRNRRSVDTFDLTQMRG
jgi:NADH-quinone oxidoreductase subunit K